MARYVLITKRADEVKGGDSLALAQEQGLLKAGSTASRVDDVLRAGMVVSIELSDGSVLNLEPHREVGLWVECP